MTCALSSRSAIPSFGFCCRCAVAAASTAASCTDTCALERVNARAVAAAGSCSRMVGTMWRVLRRQLQLQLHLQANTMQISIAQVMPCLQYSASVDAIPPIVAPSIHTTLCCSMMLNHSQSHPDGGDMDTATDGARCVLQAHASLGDAAGGLRIGNYLRFGSGDTAKYIRGMRSSIADGKGTLEASRLGGSATEGEIDASETWRLLRVGREKAAALCECGSSCGLRWHGLGWIENVSLTRRSSNWQSACSPKLYSLKFPLHPNPNLLRPSLSQLLRLSVVRHPSCRPRSSDSVPCNSGGGRGRRRRQQQQQRCGGGAKRRLCVPEPPSPTVPHP